MKVQIETLYETASSDGYTHTGDGIYFLDRAVAKANAEQRHGGYAVDPLTHSAIPDGNGRYYLLESTTPVSLANSKQAVEDIARKAMAKLSPAEIEALKKAGLIK